MTTHQRDILRFLYDQGPSLLFPHGGAVAFYPAPERPHAVPVVRARKVLLNSLVRHGWVETVLEPRMPSPRTQRLLYRLTNAGLEAIGAPTTAEEV
jgi:hypothetical protein